MALSKGVRLLGYVQIIDRRKLDKKFDCSVCRQPHNEHHDTRRHDVASTLMYVVSGCVHAGLCSYHRQEAIR